MPSFDYPQKIKHTRKKTNCRAFCSNWEFWTYFFTEINVLVNYRKKVPLGTGTEFQVPLPYRFKRERYPTLLNKRNSCQSKETEAAVVSGGG